jgi:hypothetical protein
MPLVPEIGDSVKEDLEKKEDEPNDHNELDWPDPKLHRALDGFIAHEGKKGILSPYVQKDSRRDHRKEIGNPFANSSEGGGKKVPADLKRDVTPIFFASCQSEIDHDHHYKNGELCHPLKRLLDRASDDIDNQKHHHGQHEPTTKGGEDLIESVNDPSHLTLSFSWEGGENPSPSG